MKMSTMDTIAFLLVVVGALNWGLIGFGVGDVVEMVLGMTIAKIVYMAVGVAGVLMLYGWYSKKK